MWLDCILLFPLIMLGLEKLVKEKKGMLYCVTLGLSILSNYYISIMICLFMVIYFICLLILEGKRRARDFFISLGPVWRIFTDSRGAGRLCALPEIAALQSTASGDFNFPKTYEMYFSIFDMLARHIGNVQTETGLEHWPNIYCGVAVFMFFLLYLACKKIPVKEKAVFCRTAASVFCQLFNQCTEFYLARVPLSEQPALPPVLYLHFPDTVHVLPGLYASGRNTEKTYCGRILGVRLLCASGTEAGDGPRRSTLLYSMWQSSFWRSMQALSIFIRTRADPEQRQLY